MTPEERIEQGHKELTGELEADLLDRLRAVTPAQFERIIVELLVAMGYGGGRLEMAKALGRSGDNGVDGVVREDKLGLDVVYMQAKRYGPTNSVGAGEVRDFIGALDGHRASKGVFVTTSTFSKSAHEFIERISKRVVLIDGRELATLMVAHSVGVRVMPREIGTTGGDCVRAPTMIFQMLTIFLLICIARMARREVQEGSADTMNLSL